MKRLTHDEITALYEMERACNKADRRLVAAKEHDAVNHPSHYTFGKYEVADVLEDWFPADPLLWQAGKYIARAAHKGRTLEDLKKAAWYLARRIKREEENNRDYK
jgi:hypothetical protein